MNKMIDSSFSDQLTDDGCGNNSIEILLFVAVFGWYVENERCIDL